LGVFTFKPYRGHTYELKIDSPAGIEGKHTLTTDEMGDVALNVVTPVTLAHEPLVVRVRSARGDRNLLVVASCRGRLCDQARVLAPDGEDVSVVLLSDPKQPVGGVYRVTVFEEARGANAAGELVPVAERLAFRRHRDRLNLEVKSDRPFYLP